MNSIQVSILAIAMALNSFMSILSSGASIESLDFDQKLRIGFTLFLAQVLMIGAGLWLGIRVGILAENSNYYIALGTLSFVGLKMIFESLKNISEKDKSDLKETRDLFIFSLSEGIIPLLLGVSIGLSVDSVMGSWIIMIALQTIAILAGFYLGLRGFNIRWKIKPEIIAGMIILAAALKMLISLSDF